MSTVADVIAAVTRRAHFRGMTADDGLRYANEVHDLLVRDLPHLHRMEKVDVEEINIAGGIAEYDLSAAFTQVDNIEYRIDATNATPLLATSIESLNEQNTAWRTTPNDVPTQAYIFGNVEGWKVGLYPPPDETTGVGGYPKLQVYGTIILSGALVLASDIPKSLSCNRIYIEGISYLASFTHVPDGVANYRALFDYEIQRETEYQESFAARRKMSPPMNIRTR